MKIKLNAIERLTILNLIPLENNISTLRLIRDMTSKVGLSADELKEFGVVKDGPTIKWNKKGSDVFVEIEFKAKEYDLVVDALDELDKNKKMNLTQLSVYEKFVVDEEIK